MKLPAAVATMAMIAIHASSLAAQAPAGTLAQAVQLVEAERFAEAKPLLLRITADEPANAAAAFWAGRALLALGEHDAAVKQLERAVQQQQANADYLLWLGRAYGVQTQNAGTLRQPGLARKTRATFERVVALDPDNLDARSHLIDFHLQAPGIMGGNKQTALQQAQEIRARDAWRGAFELARVQLAMDQKAAAEQTMHALIREFPDSTSPRITLALYYQNENHFDHAYATLAPLVHASPPSRAALYQFGRLAAVSGRFLDEGEAALRQYVTRAPGRNEQPLAAAHWRLGMILEHRADRDGARREYEAALQADPEYRQAREALRKLR